MQSATRYIIATGISLGILSMLYFLSLVLHIPFYAILPVIFASAFFLFWWIGKGMAGDTTPLQQFDISMGINRMESTNKYPVAAFLALVLCIGLIIQKSYGPAYKYGGWDAWCFWNLHAKYLAGGIDQWKNMFLNPFADHADYPLLLPGINGFFMRLCAGKASVAIPFVFAFTMTILIPVLIYLENLEKNIVVAVLILFLMSQDVFYLFNGVSQYADVVLGFFFLCALICINYYAKSGKYVALAAAASGCCAWTKNEGAILAVIFILFNARVFFSAKNFKYFAAGIALPLLVLLIFKIGYAPPNDLASGQGRDTLRHVFEGARYRLIYSHFAAQMDKNFIYLKIGFVLYLLLCLIERKWPGKQFFIVVACMAAYMMVYVLSNQVLEWHLATSLERLMIQLAPAMVFVFSQRFCRVHLSLGN